MTSSNSSPITDASSIVVGHPAMQSTASTLLGIGGIASLVPEGGSSTGSGPETGPGSDIRPTTSGMGVIRVENVTTSSVMTPPCISYGTTTTAAPPIACAGYAASTVHGNYTYHHADNHEHAMIYIGVILAIYFSALSVLIVRYVTKERQCYVRSSSQAHRTLKKSRAPTSERRTRDRFLSCGTTSRPSDTRKLATMQRLAAGSSSASTSGCFASTSGVASTSGLAPSTTSGISRERERTREREPQPLQLIVPTLQTSSIMTSTTALVHMDTAV